MENSKRPSRGHKTAKFFTKGERQVAPKQGKRVSKSTSRKSGVIKRREIHNSKRIRKYRAVVKVEKINHNADYIVSQFLDIITMGIASIVYVEAKVNNKTDDESGEFAESVKYAKEKASK